MPGSLPTRLVEAFPFLAQADASLQRVIADRGVEVHVPDGQFICSEGRQCAHMSLVLDGVARVFKVGETGREITLYRLERGESCILTASCILNGLAFPAHAVAEGPVDAFAIPAQTFREWVDRIPVWREYVFGLFAKRLATVIAVIEEVAFRRMDERLVEYLLTATQRSGSPELRVTHEAIAAELGSSREVISRLLKDLEHRGLVQLARGSITIPNPPALSTPP